MRVTSFTVLAAALAVVGMTAGCGNDDKSDSPARSTTSTPAATSTAHPSTTTLTSVAPVPPPLPTSALPPIPPPPPVPTTAPVPPPITTVPPTTTEPALADVDCGPVTDAGGGTRTVIAVSGPAGRVGCTEAINVATTYVTTISDTDVMTVDGWQCNAQPDPATPSMCAKDGLVIALRAN